MSDGASSQGGPQRVLRLRFEPPADFAERAQAWCEHIAPIFSVNLHASSDLSKVGMVSYHLGDLLVGTVDAPTHRLERSIQLIRQQGIDHLLLQFYNFGHSRVRAGTADITVDENQVVVFDLSKPVAIDAAPVHATNLLIPRAHLEQHGIACDALHGCTLDFDTDPVLRLFHAFLQNVVACGDELEADRVPDLAQAIVRMCLASLKGRSGSETRSLEAGVAVRRFIHRELAKPDLGAETICARFGLSRSALYRMFEADGGVLNYIRDRRLLLAMKLLAQGPSAAPPVRISTLAYSVGFSDERTFTRAFKRRFGFAPSQAGLHAGTGAGSGVSALLNWIKTLVP